MAGTQTQLCTALLIDGELVSGEGFVEPILNPATGEVLVSIAEASIEQVEAAILAAHRASMDGRALPRNNARTCYWKSPVPLNGTPITWPVSSR